MNLYVLGVGITHNSTACLLKDGEIVACASEERFCRKKNVTTFPRQAIKFALNYAGINLEDIDCIAHGFVASSLSGLSTLDSEPSLLQNAVRYLSYRSPSVMRALRAFYYTSSKGRWNRNLIKTIRRESSPTSRIQAFDHHTCHAFAAYYGFAYRPNLEDRTLVLTLDGEGDGLCGSINEAEKTNLRRLVSIESGNSLAALYAATTKYLGMQVNNHEYKVMGLAPYASEKEIEKTYKVFRDVITLSGLQFNSKYTYAGLCEYFRQRLCTHRFDGIAGAVQKLVEERIASWTREAIRTYGISRISTGGGFFLNVKANMVLTDLPEVTEFYPCPSSGDESVAIGAAYLGYRDLCIEAGEPFQPKPIRNLYLGPQFSDDEIETILSAHSSSKDFSYERHNDIEAHIAELIAKSNIVARLSGRMEWGARALGNRSIVADPSNTDIIRQINEQIKARDFWMPFAPTILDERALDYIINPKRIPAPHMILAFNTTPLARKQLKAALHPYDFTARPQVLKRDDNPQYYDLIKHFERITGIGAVLNTSFNIHGEPIVCTPADALDTFLRSGLRYLALGEFMLAKNWARTRRI